jgi:hypothetical protein
MAKRLLDCNPSDFASFTADDLLESIRYSEGRVVVCETIALVQPIIDKVSNAELAAAFSADIIIFNLYDVNAPSIAGLPDADSEKSGGGFGHIPSGKGRTLAHVKSFIGRPVGLNLEPIENPEAVTSSGRLAVPDNATRAVEQGADFLVITGNPGTGVTREGICRSIREIRSAIGRDALIFAGKGHAAGSLAPVVAEGELEDYIEAGADVIGLPAPGTIPGMSQDKAAALIDRVHAQGSLALTLIGTSQEGASPSTIEQIALMSKMAGADMQHIGDAGTIGLAAPENIMALSMAIRGRRHTWHRMAASLHR